LVAGRLAQSIAPCLVVDPTRLADAEPLPADLPGLLSENSDGMKRPPAPRLWCLPPDDPRLEQFVQQNWARDAVVCVYPRSDAEDLIGGLQHFARCLAADPANRRVARLTPGALADFLANSAADQVAPLWQHVVAMFFEVHQGDRWALFSDREFEALLRRIGLTPAPLWQG
jgi:hypothetical protein